MQFQCQKQFNFKQFNLAYEHSLVLFDPLVGPYQVLLLRVRVDQGVMSMKGYSKFHKPPAILELHYQNVQCYIQDNHSGCGVGVMLLLSRDAVGVFYRPSRLGNYWVETHWLKKFQVQQVSKEGLADSLKGPWKRCNCKHSFLLPTPEVKFTWFIYVNVYVYKYRYWWKWQILISIIWLSTIVALCQARLYTMNN